MSTEDQAVMDAYTAEGIELPPEAAPAAEPESAPAPEPAATPEPEAAPVVTPEGEAKAPEHLTEEPKERKPRSIYHDLKDTRNDLKTERELREKAERERDEALAKANKPATEMKADDLDAFAEEIGADPAAIKKMRELFLKDMPASTISPELQTKLEQFEAWQKDNGQAIASQQFETEFNSAIPQLQRMFPNASKEDIVAMKSEIDTLAHTTEYHDKEIDYIAFRNQEKLATLITPHKRGLESKGRVDATNIPTTFDPNADVTKMSPKEAEVWEKGYNDMMKNSELVNDSIGRRVML